MSSILYIDPTKPHFPVTSQDPRANPSDPIREVTLLDGDSMFELLGTLQGWAGALKSAAQIQAEPTPSIVKVTIG